MMQVENEYGSYGEEQKGLSSCQMVWWRKKAWPVTLFTSDGPWRATLRTGALIEEDLFVTETSVPKQPITSVRCKNSLTRIRQEMAIDVCGILGWLVTRWKEPVIRDEELAEAVHKEVLEFGSIVSICFMAGPISWMVAQLGGAPICHRWRSYD